MKTQIPANFPPSSYAGKQFVDNRGCIYVRAGIDGNVTWVPRMTRARKHICNAQPTFANAPAPEPAARQTAAAEPKMLPPPADAPKARAPERQAKAATSSSAAPKPTVRRVAQPVRVTASQPRRVTVAPSPAAPKPRQMATPARKVVKKRAPVLRGSEGGCRWASPQSAQYMRGEGVRCGPQNISPLAGVQTPQRGQAPVREAAGVRRVAAAPAAARVTPATRIAPLHVAKAQAQVVGVGRVPPGYRRVWEDDRLNPRRAHQTLAGKQQMDRRWTREVPRRLIDISSGMDVTAFNPDLVYPYTSMQEQRAAPRSRGGYLSTSGRTHETTQKPTVSTRSAPKAPVAADTKAVRVAVSHRFVQVGRYPSGDAARRDAARLKRAGLTVRMGTLRGNDGQARVLLAGPYSSPQALGNALYAARKAGFSGAFTHK
ncbi:SPOR domain-containing protein [Lutimaribacter degradans]|uniref:SPOR domain-containing protein n=1 Tax=Lutimaribacter degradans TaxID=2945989 RepID=UPI00204033FE|nr:SPOR domain-containing protein [Lutimaribacter sp. EGI FJ00013]